jgi:type I restriction enzyme S subunit
LGKQYGSTELEEYPYLRVANVQDGHIDLSTVTSIMVPAREAALYRLQAGDVLMNEGGDEDKLGRGAIWDGQIDPCLHQNHVFCVRPFGVSSEWLDTWTAAAPAKHYFQSKAKRATNLASISATNIKEMPLLLPPPDEQAAILAHLAKERARTAELEKALRASIALLKERRAALIAAAVTGQLELANT